MDLSFIINELGENFEDQLNAIAPPIYQTSNFKFNSVDDFRSAFANKFEHNIYSRGNNPTVTILRQKLAALDGAEDALVFNSGAAAIYAAVMSNVQSGDHILSVREPYSWAQKIFNEICPKFGISCTYIDGRKVENFENAIQPNTKIIFLESPGSWFFELQDIEAIAKLAKSKNILTIIDNSYCTPLFQQPIKLGIDLSLQSATKYIGGHSDVVAGVLSGSKQQIKKIFDLDYMAIGSGIQPFNAWLLLRGLRTLPIRLNQIAVHSKIVLDYLKKSEFVEKVIFPFDENFEQIELAKKQMTNAAGLMTIILKTKSRSKIEAFCNSLKRFKMAVSWGGYESLIIPGCAGISVENFSGENIKHRSCRLYIGLEDPKSLIEDLEQGFEKIKIATD